MDQKKIFTERIKNLQRKFKSGEAILITSASNVFYLCGFTGTNGQILISSEKAYFLTDFRYLRVAKNVLPKNVALVNVHSFKETLNQLLMKEKCQKLFFEETDLSYSRFKNFQKNLKVKKLMPSLDVVEAFRIIKSEQEILLITKAQRIAEKVFKEVRKNLRIGMTELEVSWQIEKLGRQFGADCISFPSIVCFGSNSGSPHHQCGKRKLKKGDLVLIDMGMKYKGYCSDMTRMIFTQKPTPLQQKIYNLVLEAQETTIQKLKVGVTGKMADGWARTVITKAGYGKTFGHALGHGIGLDVHELPYLSTNFPGKLPANTIVTVEPGIYLENSFGVRIEDMVLIRPDRVINLTKIAKKIEDCVFPVS